MSAKDPSPGGSSSPENQEDLALLVHSSCAKIEEDDVRKCSSCSRRKPTSDFSGACTRSRRVHTFNNSDWIVAGKATCDQCRVKKRKHCAVQVASVYSALNSTRPLGCPRGELQSLTLERSQPTYTFPPCYSNLSSLPDAAALQFTH